MVDSVVGSAVGPVVSFVAGELVGETVGEGGQAVDGLAGLAVVGTTVVGTVDGFGGTVLAAIFVPSAM